MKRILIAALLCVSSCLYAQMESGNVVGYETHILPPGKTTFRLKMLDVSSGRRYTLKCLLEFANVGDRVVYEGGEATVGLADDGKHWFGNNKNCDDVEIDPDRDLIYLNAGSQPIEINISGAVTQKGLEQIRKRNGEKTQDLQQPPKVEKKSDRPPLMLADVLSYLTVQIVTVSSNSLSTGTGFFFDFIKGKYRVPAVVTNRHVADHIGRTFLTFTVSEKGRPSARTFNYARDLCADSWIWHPDPDIDLAALPILPIINAAREEHKVELFMAPLSSAYIPDDNYFAGICQLDDIAMIGYPDSIRDQLNNQPIFRKGSIATNPNKRFNGKREFLIDVPVYGGSSGSPILLVDEGPHIDRTKKRMEYHGRIKLIGVNKEVYIHREKGKLKLRPVSGLEAYPEVEIPNSLGVAVHASCIRELEDSVFRTLEIGDM